MLQENELTPKNDLMRNLRRAGIVAGGVFVAVLLIGAIVRWTEASNLKSWTAEADIPTVTLISPSASATGQALVLPGTLQAYNDAELYSRVPCLDMCMPGIRISERR